MGSGRSFFFFYSSEKNKMLFEDNFEIVASFFLISFKCIL